MTNPLRAFALFGGLALASTFVGCNDEVKKENPPVTDVKPATVPPVKHDVKDMKPADTAKPVEVKPIEVKPIEPTPAVTKPAEVKPAGPKLEAPAAPKEAAKKL